MYFALKRNFIAVNYINIMWIVAWISLSNMAQIVIIIIIMFSFLLTWSHFRAIDAIRAIQDQYVLLMKGKSVNINLKVFKCRRNLGVFIGTEYL